MTNDFIAEQILKLMGDEVIQRQIKEFKMAEVLDNNFQLSKIMIEELRALMIAAIGGGLMGMIASGETDLKSMSRVMEKQVMAMIMGFCKAVQLMDRMDVIR